MADPSVLIDATAVPADRGGVGRYVDSLVAALDGDGARLTVVCQPRDTELYRTLAPHARVVTARESVATRTARLAWEQTTLPRMVRELDIDVLHSPHYTMPLTSPAATVVTMHDATFFTEPAMHSPVKGMFFRGWTRRSLRHAQLCVVPSAATGVELARVAGADPDTVHVCPHGVDSAMFHPPSPGEVDAVRRRLDLGRSDFVAFLGALEPRKNVPALIRGFAAASVHRADPPVLVLAGQPGWDSHVERALDAVPRRLRVIRAGYLPLVMLSGFLGGASVVAYPSIGEGFGLPVLEAMSSGGCVLTTKRLALPEVGGEAVRYGGIGAGDIAAALGELLDDSSARAELSAAAQRRAKEFSWHQCAEKHREAYERALRLHRTRPRKPLYI